MARVALAYSGRLDTAICVHWLKAVKGLQVVTFSANVGQPEYLEPLSERALALGAGAAHVADLRDRFAWDFILPSLRAGAVYEGGYHLFCALARPLIIEELVNLARDESCDFVAHGGRASGNDAIRFRNGLRALAPELKILAPLQELGHRTPEDDLRYAKENSLPVDEAPPGLVNVEENLGGVSLQYRAEDAWALPPAGVYRLTVAPDAAPAAGVTVSLGFQQGTPVTVDGKALPPVALLQALNRLGGAHGVGRFDLVENRIAGHKTREIYESPAVAVLTAARRALESIVLDRALLHFQEGLRLRYADLVYEGHWFTLFRESLDAFFARTQEKVSGVVACRLHRGHIDIVRAESPHSRLPHQDATSLLPVPGQPKPRRK